MLIGNKADLTAERAVKTEEGVQVARVSKAATHNDFLSNAHTHPFNGPLSGTTRVSRYQKGKTNLDFTEARDSEWQ